MKCDVCFRHCDLQEGQIGFCRARGIKNGKNVSLNYGLLTSLALDPIEKKPLREFYPHSLILSAGSYGCNLRCPFCQNFEISQQNLASYAYFVSPEALIKKALSLVKKGNIGVAFTYNEPLVSYEYVRDSAALAKKNGLKTVLVTNGTCAKWVLELLLPFIDAMNIDLKGFSKEFYDYVGGSFEMTKDFIALASQHCHVELTTLIVPKHNDSLSSMEKEAQWIASINPNIPLHITRYFPCFHESEPSPSFECLAQLKAVAEKYLSSVYLGNI